MPYLTVQSRRAHFVHYRTTPAAGTAVVFVHGAGGSHQHWLYQVRDLRIVPAFAVDLPGHGRSEGPDAGSIAAYTEWLLAFLNAAGLDRAVVAGHSMGGAIAMDMALRYPSRVAGLGLVATGARLRVAPAILEGLARDPEAAIRLITGLAFGPETPSETMRLAQRQMAGVAADVIRNDFVACDAFDVMSRLGDISAPTQVICGTQDHMTPLKYSCYLRDRIPGAALHTVEGAGHMVMMEKPADVTGALAGLLSGLDSGE